MSTELVIMAHEQQYNEIKARAFVLAVCVERLC